MRSSALDNLAQDYIRLARAKGLSERAVLFRHLLRNACLPMITLIGLSIPTLLAGNLLIEVLFNYPGLGLLFFNALGNQDYNILLAYTILGGILTVLGNLLADVALTCGRPQGAPCLTRCARSSRPPPAGPRSGSTWRPRAATFRASPRGWRLALREFLSNRLAVVGLGVLLFFVAFCFLGPLIHHTNQTDFNPLITDLAPGGGHLLGTDEHGFDELGRIMLGGQTALEIGFLASLIATVIGTL